MLLRRVIHTIATRWRYIAVVALCLLIANDAFALDPNLTIAQFKHTGWTNEQGAPAYVLAITQSQDGFLWLGSAEGLFRFDGISFEKIPLRVTKPARSDFVTALLGTSTGDIWVGHYWGGVSVFRNGRLQDANPAPPTGEVYKIVEDKFGAIWIWSDGSHFASLRRYADGKWTILDHSWGLPRAHLSDILAARNGDLWLAFDHQLAILPHGAHQLKWIDEKVGVTPRLAETSTGQVLVADAASVKALPVRIQFVDEPFAGVGQGPLQSAFVLPLLVDRDDSLWLTNPSNNLERIAHPQRLPASGLKTDMASTDIYARKPGLSSDTPLALFEDREGTIWSGTDAGLDRFRSMNIVPVLEISDRATTQRLPMTSSNSGRVYGVAFDEGVARPFEVGPGIILRYLQPSQSLGYPLCASRDGGAWFVGVRQNEFFDVREDTVVKKIVLPPEQESAGGRACVEAGDGALWIARNQAPALRYDGRVWKQLTVTQPGEFAWSMGPDGHGGALIYVPLKYLVDATNESVRILRRQKDIPIGLITLMVPGPKAVLLGGQNGLARYDGKTIRVLGADRLPILNQIMGIVQTERGQTWILTLHHLILVSSSELDAAFDHPGRVPGYRDFDYRDGFSGSPGDNSNHLALAADGHIWMLTSEGYFRIDPKNLYSNKLPPPVSIRSLTADGVVHPALRSIALPSGTSNLEVDYSVLSLRTPERNTARYKLDGVVKTWIDSGLRRQAFYTNLGPGSYQFHVIASNDDAVWNRTGQTLSIVIPPTFLQSDPFLVLCVLGGMSGLWVLYQLRIRQLAAQYRGRLLERLSERERIARELHDTLLQGVQGLILRFQVVADQIAPDTPSRQAAEGALQRAESVLLEGRDRVKQLRLADRKRNLAALFEQTGKDLASGGGVRFSVTTDGAVRDLHPIVYDEVVGIGAEAMTNAFSHANASHIVLLIIYGRARFGMCVRDDGRGIDATILASGGREGHFGLQGMRERAEKIGGELSLSSRDGRGAEIALTIPGHIAYASARSIGFRSIFGRASLDEE